MLSNFHAIQHGTRQISETRGIHATGGGEGTNPFGFDGQCLAGDKIESLEGLSVRSRYPALMANSNLESACTISIWD